MYTLITEEGRCGGVIQTKPNHENWTTIPYLGGLIKEYWNGEEWIEKATQEEINTLNQQKLEELNQLQYEELSKTDWVYIRQKELGIEVPEEIIKQRQEIRDKYKKLKNE